MSVPRTGAVLVLTVFVMVGVKACGDDGGGGGEVACNDQIDNDQDGLTDCNDSDCANASVCTGLTETNCSNGLDDDTDGLTDCDDPDCTGTVSCPDPVCGNSLCEAGETNASCADDCFCGNGSCDSDEDANSCSDDCSTGACDEPVDLVTQSGCTPPEVCTVDGNGDIVCGSAGSNNFYEDCSNQMGCVAGSMCVGSGGSVVCAPFCDQANPDCPQDGLCNTSVETNQGRVNVCALPVDCNVLTGDGCTGGDACYYITSGGDKVCAAPGAGGEGDPCTFVNDCAAAFNCMGNPSVCRELCDLNNDQCSQGACTAAALPEAGVGICQ